MERDLGNFKKYETQYRDSERERSNLAQEIERLNNIIRNNSNELRDFQTRYSKLETSLQDYRSVEQQLKEYENKIVLLVQ